MKLARSFMMYVPSVTLLPCITDDMYRAGLELPRIVSRLRSRRLREF
jgi:hypothetical protein